MVAGFSYPDGDPGGLDGVARSLGTLSGDLTTEKGNVSSGVATTLRTWEATRSDDFEDAGRGITGTLDGASGVVDAAQEWALAEMSAETIGRMQSHAGAVL